MRKLIFLGVALIGFNAWAQEKPVISSAVIAIDRNNDVKSAKEYIDEAASIISAKSLSEVREKDLAKFYFYKGKINYRVHQSGDEAVRALDPNALDKALEGYSELLAFEKQVDRERYTDDARQQLQYLANDIARRGIEANGNQDWNGAYEDFLTTYQLKNDYIGMVDTSMYFNAAIMAQQGKMYGKAIEIYRDLIDMGYKGVTFSAVNVESGDTTVFTNKEQMANMVESGKFANPMVEGDVRTDLYKSLTFLALANGDTALYKSTLEEGRKMFPNNVELLKAELQLFFDNKEYDKALANLDAAIAADPKNVVMHYNKGVILQTEMGRTADALEAYGQALEIDSMYADALYMSSIIYIDSANAIGQKMNDLPLNATTKYKKLEKQQKEVFQVSLPYLEKARVSNPNDEQVNNALMQVYRALKMYDKAKALMAEQAEAAGE